MVWWLVWLGMGGIERGSGAGIVGDVFVPRGWIAIAQPESISRVAFGHNVLCSLAFADKAGAASDMIFFGHRFRSSSRLGHN